MPVQSRRTFLSGVAGGVMGAVRLSAWARSTTLRANKPNVVFILVDDLG